MAAKGEAHLWELELQGQEEGCDPDVIHQKTSRLRTQAMRKHMQAL